MAGELEEHAAEQWDGHLLLLHDSESERHAGLAAWVRRRLERGEKVIYTEAPVVPRRSALPILEADGVDASAAVAEGRLVVLPSADWTGFPGWSSSGDSRDRSDHRP